MKKVLIMMLIGLLFLASACKQAEDIPNSTNEDNVEANEEANEEINHDTNDKIDNEIDQERDHEANDKIKETSDDQSIVKTENPDIDNPFFFKDSKAIYTGSLLTDVYKEIEVALNIIELDTFKNARLYELRLEPIESLDEYRLNLGYFYVEKDRIYMMDASKENYNTLKNTGKLPDDSVIVCQEKEIEDALGEDGKGHHHWLESYRDMWMFRSYDNLVHTGYYESFVWEKGKGIIYYKSGYGARRDGLELHLISKPFKGEELKEGYDEYLAEVKFEDDSSSKEIHRVFLDDLTWVFDPEEDNDYRIFNQNEEWVSYELDDACTFSLYYQDNDFYPYTKLVSKEEFIKESIRREEYGIYTLARVVARANTVVEISEMYQP